MDGEHSVNVVSGFFSARLNVAAGLSYAFMRVPLPVLLMAKRLTLKDQQILNSFFFTVYNSTASIILVRFGKVKTIHERDRSYTKQCRHSRIAFIQAFGCVSVARLCRKHVHISGLLWRLWLSFSALELRTRVERCDGLLQIHCSLVLCRLCAAMPMPRILSKTQPVGTTPFGS